ncbi:GNAT family N-acetyltransferase [Natronoarchaeum mannanilyticum]|uniref:N-acetyltransferase n=1 Tax=Natronoarchaeum mannanilyticum TaxID=926360 RepID=A0AAV3TE99_9EURY
MEIDRPAPDEIEELADLWVALAREQRAHGTHIRPEANRSRIAETLSRHAITGEAFVARANDEIAGFVTYERTNEGFETDIDRGVVQNLYVRPAYRDAGVGASLLDRAEADLAADGVDAVTVEVMAANEAAHRFYERNGYERHRVVLEKRLEDENHSKDRG